MTTTKKEWDRGAHSKGAAVPDTNSTRKGSVLNGSAMARKRRWQWVKRPTPDYIISGHDYIIAQRAARLGIKVIDYLNRYCK